MDNKGFGIVELFIFLGFTVLVIFTAFTFFNHLVGDILYDNSGSSYNYENPYTKYYKDGTISRVDNTVKSKSNKTIVGNYSDIEKELSKSAKEYFNDNYKYLDKNDSLYVKSSTLKENGYIDSIKNNEDESICTGYTIITNNGGINYKSYISCPNYKTSGYCD